MEDTTWRTPHGGHHIEDGGQRILKVKVHPPGTAQHIPLRDYPWSSEDAFWRGGEISRLFLLVNLFNLACFY